MSDLFTQDVVVGNCQPETSPLSTFDFYGRPVRVIKDENGEPWFVAKDVCECLEIRTDTVRVLLEEDEVMEINPNTIGIQGGRNPIVVSEAGLYSLVLRSRKTDARAFKRWVTHEVLPAIRRDGGYIHAAPDDPPEIIMAKALKVADATMKRQQEQLEQARATIAQQGEQLELAAPKVAFVENFCTSKGTVLVRDFAKTVSQSLNLRGFGEKVLFEWLKKRGYLNENRYPTQRAADLGLFRVYEGIHQHNDGTTGSHHCSRITNKGQVYFYEKIKDQYESVGRWW